MINIEVLISTMNQENIDFLKKLNLSTNAVVINQSNFCEIKNLEYQNYQVQMITKNERGLSKSRNCAISNSKSDICVIADDDITYTNDYSKIIQKAYLDNPNADIIAFQVERVGPGKKVFRKKAKWENYLSCMKISSVEITFRRKSIIDNNILFNENLGAGAHFLMGEENVFLYEAMKKKLKVLYLPIKIGEVDTSESTWFKGYNAKYFQSLGAAYYNMSKYIYPFLIFQFSIRKYKLYSREFTYKKAIKEMFKGVIEYKKNFKDKDIK